MALMAAHGEITPMPDCAIFADTQDEPQAVYEWLDKLENLLPFPAYRVTNGRLSDSILNGHGFSQIPAWFRNDKGLPSLGRRQCSKYFKVLPVRHKIRELYPGRDVTLWMGISWDEIGRMKPSLRQWLTHRFPLIDGRIDRRQCEKRLAELGFSVPKSACVYCPYRGPKQWRATKLSEHEMQTVRRVESVLLPRGEFLTSQLMPIQQADFRSDEDRGQVMLFGNECEGMCGV